MIIHGRCMTSRDRFGVYNPYTRELIKKVAVSDLTHVKKAVHCATEFNWGGYESEGLFAVLNKTIKSLNQRKMQWASLIRV